MTLPNIPVHISALFIFLVFALAFLVVIAVQACSRRSGIPETNRRKNFLVAVIVVLVWLVATFMAAASGFLLDFSLPPRLLVVVVPPILIVLFVLLNEKTRSMVLCLDDFWLIYPQSFRILMELILWMLFRNKIIPEQMTFEGRNYDIIIGITAPLIAYYCFNKRAWPKWIAVVWNMVGLALLFNIVYIAVVSSPYPFRQYLNEPANLIPFYFPFVWLPSFVVPFALLLHLLSLRSLLLKRSS